GKQATTLGGTTIHSIASVPDENSQTPARRLSPKKKALWKDVTVLIIEEVSMVSAKMLAALHVAAVASLGADASLPFGGLDIVALGDFSQLQPVASKGLASGFSKDIGAAVLASSSSSAFGGQQLFLSMTAWVMLVRSKRFTEPLRGIVERLRVGSCTSEDRDILNSTTIGAGNIRGNDCHLSTMIVLRNKIRCALAVPLARSACARNNVCHYVSKARDKLRIGDSRLYTGRAWPAGLRSYVNQLEDNKTMDLPRETSLAIGMQVILRLQTQYVGAGVCNNSSGIIRKIVLHSKEPDMAPEYATDVYLRQLPLYVLVYVEDAHKRGLHLPGLDPGVVAIKPHTRTIRVTVPSRYSSSKKEYYIKRRQLPLCSGNISSVHRAQGESLDDCLLDLRQPQRKQGGRGIDDSALIYVAISRATSLEAIRLL
ncbi:unnamed protein product, partial [Ectocarpus fasciculatus]